MSSANIAPMLVSELSNFCALLFLLTIGLCDAIIIGRVPDELSTITFSLPLLWERALRKNIFDYFLEKPPPGEAEPLLASCVKIFAS
jgi:hypothetical protein